MYESNRHVEAVQITFDPEVTSFENILDIYFKTFDPTDDQGQFFDRGESYQPVIFYHDEHQKKAAEFKKQQLNEQGIFKKPVITPIKPYKISIQLKTTIKIIIKRTRYIITNINVVQVEKRL